MTGSDQQFVIVGASLAGAKAAETLRAEGFTGRIVLVGEEPDRPYERPPLSKDLLLGPPIGPAEREKAFVHEASWYAQNRVELRSGVRAAALDRVGHAVELADGSRLAYDRLLLATGSVVRRLDVSGGDLAGVRYLRRIGQSERIRADFGAGRRFVVVGAGWIGLEVAAAARQQGCEVTVVDSAPLPLRHVLGDEAAEVFADLHRAHGVGLRMPTGVGEIAGADGRVRAVVLQDGTELPADVVVVGVGIRPAVELAEAAGLEVQDGVLADQALRTSDPDIFAAGDVVNAYNPLLGRRIRVEHWANALHGGPAAARSMLGQDVVYDRVPYFFSDQYDLGMEYSGYVAPGGYDRVVFRGDKQRREFVAFWLSGDRVLAGMNVNVWDVQDQIQALVRSGYAGTAVDLTRLADSQVPLGDLVA